MTNVCGKFPENTRTAQRQVTEQKLFSQFNIFPKINHEIEILTKMYHPMRANQEKTVYCTNIVR